jgi:hypothetical protein
LERKGLKLARLKLVVTWPVPGSKALTAAIALSLIEKLPLELTYTSKTSRSVAGFSDVLSVYCVGGAQFKVLAGVESPTPADNPPPLSPPPQPDRERYVASAIAAIILGLDFNVSLPQIILRNNCATI